MRSKVAAAALSFMGATALTSIGAMAGGMETAPSPVTVINPKNVASVTYGPYVRAEIGAGRTSLNDAYWLPPGYPADPRVNFDLESKNGGLAAIAFGYDWMNGFRGDISLIATSKTGLKGPWTSPTPGPHADITAGSVRTTALMANLFYSPLEQQGVNSRIQPFLVAGIGLAGNKVGQWTRTNAAAATPVRTFEGSTTFSPAFSVGVGVSMQLTNVGTHPVMLEASYRYYQFGKAQGGSASTSAGGTPVQPLTFNTSDQVLSLGIRIPLNRL
ncbi:hypothetical protein [uncultured Thioclava sp.]|nr:hypothetical protein [uncultured Thioclava sp.]